ncbi:unnamed protein product, partial [Owenia fusiformis]
KALKRTNENDDTSTLDVSESKHTRRCSTPLKLCVCFFCGQTGEEKKEVLHEASTFGLDATIRRYAQETGDQSLLTKLAGGDMIATEGQYHASCKLNLFNKVKAYERAKDDHNKSHTVQLGIAFAELISYIEDSRSDDQIKYFKLNDLFILYTERAEQLGVDFTFVGKPNKTRFKEKILDTIPDIQAHRDGRDVHLIFNDAVTKVINNTLNSCDDDAIILAKAARIVRRDIKANRTYSFDDSFPEGCQNNVVPDTLTALVNMIIDGSSIKECTSESSQCSLSIAQLLMFNSVTHKRRNIGGNVNRRDKRCETPIPLYVGISVYQKTRKRELVDKLYQLGLSVSYNRVQDISVQQSNKICQHFESIEAVCPPQLKMNLFTTGAVDNLDHNQSSTIATNSFHGTGISLFQHPDGMNQGIQQQVTPIAEKTKDLKPLPEYYKTVPPTVLKKESNIPQITGALNVETYDVINQAYNEAFE